MPYTIVWPAVNVKDDPTDPDDDKTSAAGSDPGTFVSTQTGGPTLCGAHVGVKTPTGAGGSCRDRIAPVSRFARRRSISARRLHFSGSASDKGCRGANGINAAGKVAKVFVSVAKVKGNGRGKDCRFLTTKGTLARYRSCRKATLLRARGARRWSITLTPRGLPAGKYRVVVRAIDASKNKERPKRGRNISRFRIG